jgi:pimeloyl-ACP methyl ester carboxylesterase
VSDDPHAAEPSSSSPAIWSDEAGPAGAPLVVLIHGSMDRSSGMLKLSRVLDGRYRVCRYDRRGYGRSIPPNGSHPGPFTMDRQVADLVALMAGRPAVLVGHSYGGNVALAAAERHPHLVRAVAVYETPTSWLPWWPGTTPGSAAASTPGSPEEAAERFMRRMIGDARWEGLPERTRSTRRREGAALVGELTDLRDHAPWSPGRIRVPVLVGVGDSAAGHHAQAMHWMADVIPGARLVVLADCRHDAPLSHPALFAAALVEPLLRAPSSAS